MDDVKVRIIRLWKGQNTMENIFFFKVVVKHVIDAVLFRRYIYDYRTERRAPVYGTYQYTDAEPNNNPALINIELHQQIPARDL